MALQNMEEKVDIVYKKIMSNEDVIDSKYRIVSKEDLPEWYNEKLFKLGQDYACHNLASVITCGTIGLISVFAYPDIEILKYTKQSNTPCAAFKRYLRTILHVYTFYRGDIDDINSDLWKSLNMVRWKHTNAAQIGEKHINAKFSQQHMVLTQFGFVGYVILKSHEIGLTNEPEGVEGFIHLWKVIGHLLGIPDEINLCQDNVAETRLLCHRILEKFYKKEIEATTESRQPLIRAILDGLSYINSGADYEATIRFFYDLIGLKFDQPMSWRSQFLYWEKKTVFYALGLPYINRPIRYLLNCAVRFELWSSQRFPLRAWMKFGRKNTEISMYPVSSKND